MYFVVYIVLGLFLSTLSNWESQFGMQKIMCSWYAPWTWLTSQYKLDNIASASEHPGEGYRSLAKLMIDENLAFASPLKVYRVLEKENHLNRFNNVK